MFPNAQNEEIPITMKGSTEDTITLSITGWEWADGKQSPFNTYKSHSIVAYAVTYEESLGIAVKSCYEGLEGLAWRSKGCGGCMGTK